MKNILKTLGVAVIALVATSCSDYLSTNDSTKVSGEFLETESGIQMALNSTYYQFLMGGGAYDQTYASYQGVVGLVTYWDSQANDIIVNKNYGSSPEDIYCFEPNRTLETGASDHIWSPMYKAINLANIVIASGEKMNSTSVQPLVGQAKAIRAFSYFNLIMAYQQTYAIAKDKRGVILRLSPEDPAEMGFSTVNEVYTQIVTDLKDAESELANYSRAEKWEIDASVAAGMLARVYQVMGNWEGAFAEAQKAYNKYSTLMTRDEWYSGFDRLMEDGCAELIWGCKFTNLTNISSNTPFNLWFNHDPSYGETMMAGPLYNFLNFFVDEQYVNLFDQSDYRGTRCDKTEGVTDEDEIDVMFWHRSANPKLGGKWACNKIKSYGNGTYEGHTNGNKPYDISFPLMRGSEMLLIMAEAKANSGDAATAKQYLNTLQKSRSAVETSTSDKAALLEEIYVERRKELMGEGLAGSYDLLRLQKPVYRLAATDNYPGGHFPHGMINLDGYVGTDAQPTGTIPANDYRFIMQIPQMEFADNAAAEAAHGQQNPFSGK